ncbi:MAG TPA: 2-succinyl-5-enolpyruvyl-6-hydroxy-3-cyclohexene-1-carboxylic-acid synthase [Acidimicrobiales bacterium]|nr:2-succinyl-5-enolpyruvyl-6-hydroxy-3-cyclohexene-1-carboxylic-acid synthase [Acidimicrobiales bacterium]
MSVPSAPAAVAAGGPPAPADVQAAWCAALVDEWARAGVRRAVVCPGSRSTPLALALARHRAVEVDVRLDERSAGFVALGGALGSGRPVVVCTTSGTAAAELHAAVVEARHAGVPLLVCTADRPPELQGVGAPQTIDQRRLYAGAVRAEADLGPPDWAQRATWRSVASRLAAEACAGPSGPGPVHVNLALREPLLASTTGSVPSLVPPGRPDGAPWHRVGPLADAGAAEDAGTAASAGWGARLAGRRGVIVAGAGAGDPEAVFALADALDWPVLADPMSRCRLDRPGVVGAADALLRVDGLAASLVPEVVVRLGSPWASKVLAAWLAAGEQEQVLVDPFWRWQDPGRTATHVVRADPTRWCASVAAELEGGATRPDAAWRHRWTQLDAAAWEAIGRCCDGRDTVDEPGLARAVGSAVPADGTLVVSSSMPVRDLEWFAPPRRDAPRVLANRGANGIDGVVSTSMGVATATGAPVLALVGDLAFLHDLTAWVRPAGAEPDCTVVVADNGGGGIFSFLPQADALAEAEFERLFATPQVVDVVAVATGLGVPVADVDTPAALAHALSGVVGGGLRVVRVRLPAPRSHVDALATIHAAVAAAAGLV